jgi:hypothetical protein
VELLPDEWWGWGGSQGATAPVRGTALT